MLDDAQFDDLMDLLETVAQIPEDPIDWEAVALPFAGSGNA